MKMKKNKKKEIVRCAVYTRVSTENQAEKDYSSLESQKEHILNFIKSRKFEGWELFGIYEDRGFSAVSLEIEKVIKLFNSFFCEGLRLYLLSKELQPDGFLIRHHKR